MAPFHIIEGIQLFFYYNTIYSGFKYKESQCGPKPCIFKKTIVNQSMNLIYYFKRLFQHIIRYLYRIATSAVMLSLVKQLHCSSTLQILHTEPTVYNSLSRRQPDFIHQV